MGCPQTHTQLELGAERNKVFEESFQRMYCENTGQKEHTTSDFLKTSRQRYKGLLKYYNKDEKDQLNRIMFQMPLHNNSRA